MLRKHYKANVYGPFSKKGTITLRGIGPIKPEGIASYKKRMCFAY